MQIATEDGPSDTPAPDIVPDGGTFTLAVAADGGGEVVQSTDGPRVTLQAVPEPGWQFDRWSGINTNLNRNRHSRLDGPPGAAGNLGPAA